MFHGSRARWLIQGFLLLAVTLRALIPVGYMPSADLPFTLQLCPDGLPAQPLSPAHPHHHGGVAPESGNEPQGGDSPAHGSFNAMHCVFAAVAAATPPHADAIVDHDERSRVVALPPLSSPFQAPRFRVQQPRAPPDFS